MPKISELNVTANVATSDLLVVVKDPSGAPSTNKITAGNFMTHASRFMPYANTTAVGGIKVGSDFSVNSTGYLLFSSSQLPTANQSEGYLLTWDAVTNSAIWQTFSGVYSFKTIDGANTYSVEEHDGVLFADCNVVGENIVIVLPDAGSNPEAVIGKTYAIKNIDPGDGFVARVTTYTAQQENNPNIENPITGEFVTSFDIPNKGDEHEWIYDGTYWRHKGSQSYLPFYSASANTFTQIVLQNRSSGTNASGDVVVYSDAGDPNAGTGPFVDLGINSSQYSNAVYSIGGPNDAYLFNDGGDFAIGTGSESRNLVFHIGGTTADKTKLVLNAAGFFVNTQIKFSDGSTQNTAYTGAATGYTGSAGAVGYTGSQGATGAQGSIGYTGSSGGLSSNNIVINDSGLKLDGGSGTYWTGQSGVVQSADIKGGVYSTSSVSNNSLFTFGINGAGFMSVGVEGSVFIGTAKPSNDGGITTEYPGWLVVQNGGKFGAGIDSLGDVNVGAILKIEDGVHEKIQTKSDATGIVEHNCSSGYIFYHSSPDANWTANVTNISLSSNYATTVTLVISQGATGYYANALHIDGTPQTINWQGNVTPSVSANRVDVLSFNIINVGGNYTVLGQLTGF